MSKKPMPAGDLYQQGVTDGILLAADELWDRLRARDGCVTGGDWCGGDVIEVVDRWLQDHGVETGEPEEETGEPRGLGDIARGLDEMEDREASE